MRFFVVVTALFCALLTAPRVLDISSSAGPEITAPAPDAGAASEPSVFMAASMRAAGASISAQPEIGAGELGIAVDTIHAGAAALTHIARPAPLKMPVMPDLAPGLPIDAPEEMPSIVASVPPLTLLQVRGPVVPLAAVAAAADGSDAALQRARNAGKFVRPPSLSSARITGNRLVLRSGPARSFAAVGSLNAGAAVQITGGRQGGYVPVSVDQTGAKGWVFHRYVERVE